MVTCWKRDDLLALVCDVNFVFVTFQCDILGQVWCLIVSIPDLCHLFYFDTACHCWNKGYLMLETLISFNSGKIKMDKVSKNAKFV